jgi:hypothetical protein
VTLVIRREAVEATIQRFGGKPMKWGRVDCAQIAAHNLRQLGIKTSLMKGQRYASEHAALKALRDEGFTGLAEAVDAMLPRIAPAMAIQGDLIGMATDGDVWDVALCVAVGNGRVLGIKEGVVMILQPDLTKALTAWRANPCRR